MLRPVRPAAVRVKIIASIEDPAVIRKILMHLEQAAPVREDVRLSGPSAPPDGWVWRGAGRIREYSKTRHGCRPE